MPRDLPTPDELGPDPEPLGIRVPLLPERSGPHRVVIAGAGVAGLEALAALHLLAGDRVDLTVLDPASNFVFQALSVEDPFGRPGPSRYRLPEICADHDAELVEDTLAEVGWNEVTTTLGRQIPFDSLIVATGARREAVYREALTFRGLQDAERMHGLIQDMEAGYLRRLAFVVPPGVAWTLPLYELALQTAERADDLCLHWLEITVVTPETRPLEQFGSPAAALVEDALTAARITLVTGREVTAVAGGVASDERGRAVAEADRIVALPRLVGRPITGLPADEHGFVPSDIHARVAGLRGVYAVGDGSSQPIKQGGIGAQQALAASQHIAAGLGADVRPLAFEPVLRAKLLTGSGAWYLRRAVQGGPSTASTHAIWWPPTKVVAPHLTSYLQRAGQESGVAPAARFSRTPRPVGPAADDIELLGA